MGRNIPAANPKREPRIAFFDCRAVLSLGIDLVTRPDAFSIDLRISLRSSAREMRVSALLDFEVALSPIHAERSFSLKL